MSACQSRVVSDHSDRAIDHAANRRQVYDYGGAVRPCLP